MNGPNEWDLLVIANDVELGDTLRVELYQEIHEMILIKENRQTITMVDRNGTERMFKKTTLEGFGGPGFILSKSKHQRKLSEFTKTS